MQQNSENNNMESSNSNVSQADKRAQFFEQYSNDLDRSYTVIAKFIFENRGFFINYANGKFAALLRKKSESPYLPFLQQIKVGMDKLVEKVSPWVKAEISSLEKSIAIVTKTPSADLKNKNNILLQWNFQKFILKLFSDDLDILNEHHEFSRELFSSLKTLLKLNEVFSKELCFYFFGDDSNLFSLLPYYREASQSDIPKFHQMIDHLQQHRNFYVSASANNLFFLTFLAKLGEKEKEQLKQFSDGLIVQFSKLETVDSKNVGGKFLEDPYACFMELLKLDENLVPSLNAFLLTNPHVANYLCGRLVTMERLASWWNSYNRNLKTSAIIQHIFKNRDFYFKMANRELDQVVQQNPDKDEPLKLKKAFEDLNDKLYKEWLILAGNDGQCPLLFDFLRAALMGHALPATKEYFSISQAHAFGSFLFQHDSLLDVLYNFYFEEKADFVQDLIDKMRYMFVQNKENLPVLIAHLSQNKVFYSHLLKDLSKADSSLVKLFNDPAVMKEMAVCLSLPNSVDIDSSGFNRNDSRVCLVEILARNEIIMRELESFLLCNSQFTNILFQRFEGLQIAAAKYQSLLVMFTSRKRQSETPVESKVSSSNKKFEASRSVVSFWERNQASSPLIQTTAVEPCQSSQSAEKPSFVAPEFKG